MFASPGSGSFHGFTHSIAFGPRAATVSVARQPLSAQNDRSALKAPNSARSREACGRSVEGEEAWKRRETAKPHQGEGRPGFRGGKESPEGEGVLPSGGDGSGWLIG